MKKIPLITSDLDIANQSPCRKGYENFRNHLPQGFHNTTRPIGFITLLKVCPVGDVFWALRTLSDEQTTEFMRVLPHLMADLFDTLSDVYKGHHRELIKQAAKAFRENKEDPELTATVKATVVPIYLFNANYLMFEKNYSPREKLNTLGRVALDSFSSTYSLDFVVRRAELEEIFAEILKKYVSRPTTGHRMKKPKKERWQC